MSPVPTLAAIVLACTAGGVISVLLAAAIAFRAQPRWIPVLVSYAVGALLGAVFIDILPHVFGESGRPAQIAGFILGGILFFFLLEKLLLWRHHHHHDEEEAASHGVHEGHDLGRSGYMILIGDAFHNFTDGVIIAAAFIADTRLGIVTALAIVAHEVPQEIGDFVVLLHSGFSRGKALAMNALSGAANVAGGITAYFALSSIERWIPETLAIAAASMIYVAVADLIPGLHKRTAPRESLTQIAFIALGVATIWVATATLHPE